MQNNPPPNEPETISHEDTLLLAAEIKRFGDLLEQQIKIQRDWKLIVRNGILNALGWVFGATVVVSIFISALQPFKKLERIGPLIEKLDNSLQHRPNK